MSRNTLLSSVAADAEYVMEKCKFVLSLFPDCKIQKTVDGFISMNPVFTSKSVNKCYTDLDFVNSYHSISVVPHCKIPFDYNGKSEVISVYSSPKRSLLARTQYIRSSKGQYKTDQNGKLINVIKFARLTFNLKNNNFDDKMLNECRAHIMSFIKDNPKCQIDDKHLEPRLKKLLVFT